MSAPAYSRLFAWVGTIFIVTGVLFLLAFASFVAAGSSAVPTNAVGHYFVAFAASATLAWGWCLRTAANDEALQRKLAMPTAVGMGLMGAYRIIIVVTSLEVRAWAGWVPALEAVAFAALTLAFAKRR